MSRRALLAGGATVAAAAWLLGPAVLGSPGNALARLAGASDPTSVAFVPGVTTLAEAAGRRAVPAAGLRGGAGGLAGGLARVTVEGLTSQAAVAADGRLSHVHLDALLADPDGRDREPAAFYAWTLHKDPRVTAGGRVSFRWAVDPAPTIGLRVEVGHANSGAGGEAGLALSSHLSVFAGDAAPGVIPLREGLYLLGLAPGAWDRPAVVPVPDDPAWDRRRSLTVSVRA